MAENQPTDNRLPRDLTTGIVIGQQALWVRTESGLYFPADNTTPLPVSNFITQVQIGNIPGYALVDVAGESLELTSSFTDLSTTGGTQTLATSGNPEAWEIVSTSDSDKSGGGGTESVIITTLGDDWVEQSSVTATVNGLTPAAITGSFFRLQTAIIATPDGGSNIGDLIIRVAGGGAERGRIMAGEGNMKSSFYSVPSGKTAFAQFVLATTGKNQDFETRTQIQNDGGPIIVGGTLPVYQGDLSIEIFAPFTLPEKTDLRLEAKSANTNVFATSFTDFLVVDNTKLTNPITVFKNIR